MRKIIITCMVGNALEWYDFILYAQFAYILKEKFFPDSYINEILTFAIFAAGFIVRPIGGIIFGNIGDRFGRRISLGTEKTEYLQELHKTIVQLASPYHKRPLDRSRDVYKDMTGVQREQVDNYGVSGLLELYNPHMTLFYQYPPSSELQHAAKEIGVNFKENMVCKASKIVLGELGYNGNIQKIVYSIDIPK